ncbi:MAG: hypothetical protein PF569_00230 [Candidatus Woesearchaeota archaeon]|jgi:hypothetical protein|nr:hypothetical protein [Candidatus Woesearchaeota archaeon]
MDRKVAFVSFELDNPIEKMNTILAEDEFLTGAIEWYSDKLFNESGIETFSQTKNMIVTEDGYKIAVFSETKFNPMMN